MASEDQNPQQQPAPDATVLREVTVAVPEHLVEQFEAFTRRFIAIAKYREAVGAADEELRTAGVEPERFGPGRRGRRGRRHGKGRHGHGRCGHRSDAVDQPEATAV